MIVFNNWQITHTGDILARQYDNLSRTLLVNGVPEGYDWKMMVRVDEHFDIIDLPPMKDGVGVVLTEDQLSVSGYYKLQLVGTLQADGVTTRHTNVLTVYVGPSMSGDANWPTVPSEFSQIESNIKELNEHPSIPGENGFWLVWDLETHAYAESEFPLPEVPAGPPGQDGKDGVTFTPSVSETGVLSWTNNGGLENPASMSIRGPSGSKGQQGEQGPEGPQGPAGVAGADGKSAYQTAVEAGYAGTETAFNEALKDVPGHIANKDNPHGVTAAQAGADPTGTAASAVSAHNSSATAHSDIRTALAGKETAGAAAEVQSNLDIHTGNTTVHITAAERTKWNGKADAPKSVSVTLAAASWDSTAKTQTVTVTGVSATETAQMITPTPALASQTAYYDAGILCTGQAANSLTFTADTIPTADLTVYVVIQEVTQG